MSVSAFKKCSPGHFYAVGVGPGSPDMMTVRARRIIETADVIIAPRSKKAEQSIALHAVADLIKGQQVLECVYPMNRDDAATTGFWNDIARQAACLCKKQQSVVQITIGDPLIYSTSCYLLDALTGMLAPDCIHVIPGISAFQAASSIFREALTIQEDRMTLMPATSMDRVNEALNHCETIVLYKVGPRIDSLCKLLERRGLDKGARLVCYAEDAIRQYNTKTIQKAIKDKPGYMTTVIVHLNRCRWSDVSPTKEAST